MFKLNRPKNIKVKGLCVFCTKCKARVSTKCGETGKRISSCTSTDKHKFKVMVYIPGTKGITKTKILETRDEIEAIQQAIEFKNEMEKSNYSKKIKATKSYIPASIAEGMAFYVSYQNNETPHQQEHKIRTKGHIDEVKRYLKYFNEYLRTVDIIPSVLPIEKLDKDVVGKLKSYLLDTWDFAPKTYNNYIQFMRLFINFLMEEFDIKMKNPFKGFKRLQTAVNISTITDNEFHALMNVIDKDKSIQIFKNRINPSKLEKKNRYKPWLKDAIMLALLTGRRREELVRMKFDGILEDEAGEPRTICISDFKVNRGNDLTKKEAIKLIYVPITLQLKSLLFDMGYEEYKGKDKYILAPEETMERKTMMDFISKSFSYYYKKLNTGRKLRFYDLRKTYISYLYAAFGSNARLITGHSGEEVMKNHYIDEKVISEVAKNFEIFGLKKG